MKCQACSKDFKRRQIVDGKLRDLTHRRECLTCKPLVIPHKKLNKKCIVCGNKVNITGAKCRTCVSKIRRYTTKVKAVALLGGKCSKCGWDKHIAGLEFHHKDNNKEFAISTAANRKWEYVKKEVMKCELLCSCCHHILHCKYDEFIKHWNPIG